MLALFFAYGLGRLATRLRRQKQPFSKAVTWVLRLCVTLLGVFWGGGLDPLGLLALLLAAAGLALGIWLEARPKKAEAPIHIAPED